MCAVYKGFRSSVSFKYGKIMYATGDIYEGYWFNNKHEGRGKMVYATGDIYDGVWFNNKREGYGKMMYSNGNVYEGYWYNNNREGHGKMVYATGDIYDGVWKNDQWQWVRFGKMVYATGDIYDGVWQQYEHCKIVFTGEITNGKGDVYFGDNITKKNNDGIIIERVFIGKKICATTGNITCGHFIFGGDDLCEEKLESGTIEMVHGVFQGGEKGSSCLSGTYTTSEFIYIGAMTKDFVFNDVNGKITYTSGIMYIGEFLNGHCSGKGVWSIHLHTTT